MGRPAGMPECRSSLLTDSSVVEDVVAVVITDGSGTEHALLTWGRTFGKTEYNDLIRAVIAHRSKFGIEGGDIEPRIAMSLQEVAHAPYFHECLFDMHEHHMLAVLKEPELQQGWLAHCREQIEAGRMIWYLGDPRRPPFG